MTNFLKGNVFQLWYGIKSNEVSCIYNKHTGGKVFADATFEGLWVDSFETVKKLVVYFGLYESSLYF